MNVNRRGSRGRAFIMVGIMVLIGAIFLIVGIKELIETSGKNKFYEKTDGVVTEINRIYDYRKPNSYDYWFVVEYEADGEKYTIDLNSSNGYKEEVGKKHIVRYDPLNPGEAHLGDGVPDWAFSVFIGGFFLLIALLGGMDFKEGRATDLVILLLFVCVGIAMLYYSNINAKTLNPFKNYICFIGYAFLGAGALMLIGIASTIKKCSESNDGNMRRRGG